MKLAKQRPHIREAEVCLEVAEEYWLHDCQAEDKLHGNTEYWQTGSSFRI